MGPARTAREVMAGWDAGVSGSVVRDDRVVHVEHVWGTAVTIVLSGTSQRERDALNGIEECRRLFGEVDDRFSPFISSSEVTLYRGGMGQAGPHSADFDEVVRACLDLRATTRGAFDPWAVPGGYDPSGYVKGWAAGRASSRLAAAGFADHLVNAGGDVCARGDEVVDSGEGWPVGILNPSNVAEVIEVVRLRSESMATSGRYERGDHVINPRTGHPAVAVESATVVGPDPGVADALASAALVDGVASMEWFRTLGPRWSLHIVVDGSAHTFGPAFDEPSEPESNLGPEGSGPSVGDTGFEPVTPRV
jgi:FAD:protein FMN transferase